jgi:DNA gyrase subunit B
MLDDDKIVVLKGLEAVRKRPSMYVGPLDSPATLNKLIEQMMCISFDGALSGRCSRIAVTLHGDGSASIDNDGPGLPTENDPTHGIPLIQIMLTMLFACRAARENAEAKALCSVGIAVVNALSETLTVEIRRAGRLWRQHYRQGDPEGPLTDVGPAETTGLMFRFTPDPTIFQVRRFDAHDLHARLDELVHGTSVKVQLVDLR